MRHYYIIYLPTKTLPADLPRFRFFNVDFYEIKSNVIVTHGILRMAHPVLWHTLMKFYTVFYRTFRP